MADPNAVARPGDHPATERPDRLQKFPASNHSVSPPGCLRTKFRLFQVKADPDPHNIPTIIFPPPRFLSVRCICPLSAMQAGKRQSQESHSVPRLSARNGKLLGPLNALSHRRTRPPPAIFYRLYMYPHTAYTGCLPTSEVRICEIAGDDGSRDGGLRDEGETA